MHTYNPIKSKAKKRISQKSSPTAKILENVELLVARWEEQGQASSTSQELFDTSGFEKVVEKAIDARFSRFDKRVDQVGDQLNKLDTTFEAIDARFNSLDEKFASLQRLFQDQCKTVNGFQAKLSAGANVGQEPETTVLDTKVKAEPLVESKDATSVEADSTSQWQKQKQAILDGYDNDLNSTDKAAADAQKEKSTSDQSDDSTESALPADQAEIAKLKSELDSKLREVEVELSIHRARLSQERAELERSQAELERRTAKLDAKAAAMQADGDDGEGGNGILSRFKRHLGG